ncbi:response regulator transcription factor [Amylibacter sp.]|nr:response regulator transcription factor [Amylibacter sp.]
MSSSTKILLVNSDRDLSEALIYQLSLNDKYQIIESGDDNVFTQINNSFNIVIINSQPSKLHGHNLTKKLRIGGFKNPIIMLITQSDTSNVNNKHTIEVNEYIIKPFKYPELLKSIELHLRQFERTNDAQYNLGPYLFKPNSKILEASGNKSIRLTEKENNILKFLYQNLETIVSREILLHEVWGYNSKVTTHTLETHIYRLRQKIEIDPANACFLITETGGYRLNP